MYEKLDKLRAEVERWKNRIEDDKGKLKQAEAKLQEAENLQILADVGAMNLKPEQLAEFLKLIAGGKLGKIVTENTSAGENDRNADPVDDEDDNEDETEDSEDEKD